MREFDPRTQRSISPVVRTTDLPLAEWSVPAPGSREAEESKPGGWCGTTKEAAVASLFELAESSLKPIVFVDEPETLRETRKKMLEAATENYERHGQANAPLVSDLFWNERAGKRRSTEPRALN